MVQMQTTTPTQRLQLVSQVIARQGQYGTVSALSREYAVSRQTVYAWTAVGRQVSRRGRYWSRQCRHRGTSDSRQRGTRRQAIL